MPTHCYTVCEHKQHSMDGMPRDESRMSGRVSCTGTRGSHFFHHDPLEEELDPCLSAAVRYNKTKGIGVLRWRYLLFCIVILLALALLVVALLMILGHGSTTTPRIQTQQQQQPSPNIIIVPSADPTTPAAGRTSSSTARTGNTVSTTYPTAATSAARPTPPISSTTTRHWVYIQPPKASPPKPRPATVGPPGLLAPPTRTPVRTTASTRATTRKTTTTTTIKPPLPVKLPAEPGQAEDCQHYYKSTRGSSTSRQIYALNYGHFYAYCQVESDHVWTVLQRRTSGKLPFWNATFAEYADGFGDPDEDHWLGLERVWAFVALGHKLEMRIRLEGDFCQGKACSGLGEAGNWWGDWEFSIGNRSDHFRIKDLNFLRGNLSSYDSVQSEKEIFHNLCNGEQFTTVDADNDINKEENCASFRQRGAWWHRDCAYTALNGLYGVSSNRPTGLFWRWKPPMENITHRSYNIKPMKSLILFRVVP